MAGKVVRRSLQMVAIAAARTQRAAEAAQAAQRELATAQASLEHAEAECRAALNAIADAQSLLAHHPGSDQHRLWLESRRTEYRLTCAAVLEQQEAVDEAEVALHRAMALWQRQQLRQEHLTKHAQREGQQAMRMSERRNEDEMQGQGAGQSPAAMAL